MSTTENPFDSKFDPDWREPEATVPATPPAQGCHCGLTRRQTLAMAAGLAALPVVAAAETVVVPCVQTRQEITPCRHKFCRYYRGDSDYYGR